jgi:hypothetical protein
MNVAQAWKKYINKYEKNELRLANMPRTGKRTFLNIQLPEEGEIDPL